MTTGDEEPRPAGGGSRRSAWTVPFSALVLVVAVWAALWMAGRTGPGSDAPDQGASPGSASSAVQARGAESPGTASAGARSSATSLVRALPLPDDSLLGFAAVPAGAFVMGSDPDIDSLAFDIERWGDGRAQGVVELPRFYIARFETTVAQYQAFLAASGHRLADRRSVEAPPTHPVTFVAWTDAVAYARWLDRTLRDDPDTPEAVAALLDDGWRVALPTEAQWEKSARSDDGRIYPWGDDVERSRANFGSRGTAPVGSFDCPECPYGLRDMAGNVWEWTRSPYQPYPYRDDDDRESVAADALWVIRGGSFADPAQFVRAANRGGADPGARRPFIGFRVALTR